MLIKRAEEIRSTIDDPGQREELLAMIGRQEAIFLQACRQPGCGGVEVAIADYLAIDATIERRLDEYRRSAA
jgi:hypothetical protein